MDLAKQIGARIRELRTQQGLTAEQLSDAAGIPPESISRLERGRTVASLRSLARLAKGLGVELVDLLGSEAVADASVERVPAEVRGVAMLLARASPAQLDKARRIIEVLVEDERPVRERTRSAARRRRTGRRASQKTKRR